MSKALIALLSFSAGVMFSGLFAARGTAVQTQAPSQPQRTSRVPDTTPDGHPRVRASQITLVNVSGGAPIIGGIDPSLAIPKFEPLNTFPIVDREFVSTSVKRLDGLDCRSCTFENSDLVYGGGPFNLEDAHLRGKISIAFDGAAANTANMLAFLEAVQNENSEIPKAVANTPITQHAKIKHKPSEVYNVTPPFLQQQ